MKEQCIQFVILAYTSMNIPFTPIRKCIPSVHMDSAQTLAFYNVENAWENNAMHFVLVQQEITAAHRSKIKPTMMKYRPVCLCML